MKILFLCVANSARSQLAEAQARALFGNKATIASAGSEPSGTVNPFALEILKENNILASGHLSKHWSALPSEFMASLDFVITLCAEELCPVVPSTARRLHWPLPDPASEGHSPSDEERKIAFRRTSIEIQKRLEAFGREQGVL